MRVCVCVKCVLRAYAKTLEVWGFGVSELIGGLREFGVLGVCNCS